jgi:peptide/bleomycin uptake transporter
MFVQFFREPPLKVRAIAWLGLCVVLGYSAFAAWTKARLNTFYNDFYNLMQVSGTLLVAAADDDVGSGGFELGNSSGADVEELELDELGRLRRRVYAQLLGFGGIVAPLVFAAPISKWVRSEWSFAWRVALMRSYLAAWDVRLEPIEGASQRLHEDTQRFCVALQGCLATVLDAIFTLAVFAPILIELSDTVPPPIPLGPLRSGWLLVLAYAAASVSLFGALVVGHKLVGLEVNNQRVEAGLRRDLVMLEAAPSALLGEPAAAPGEGGPARRRGLSSPLVFFNLTLKRLAENYHSLYRNFAGLNLWLTFFDQVMVIMPYALAAPLLFASDPAQRITLGTLVKLSNSFDRVFGSLSIISENWGAVNEFRSVVRRLSEFEAQLYAVERRAAFAQTADGGPPPPPGSPRPPRRGLLAVLAGGGASGMARARLTTPPPTPPLATDDDAAGERQRGHELAVTRHDDFAEPDYDARERCENCRRAAEGEHGMRV